MKRVGITGALGNLGTKLIEQLTTNQRVSGIIGLDQASPTPQQRKKLQQQNVQFLQCDLGDWRDERWREALKQCGAVVHFAAQNPYPEANWDDANTSLDMTMNVALSAVDAGVERFVFASSNHVMGRYKDEPLASTIGPGQLTTNLGHAVGTLWHTGDREMDSTIYATAKSCGERLCHALARRSEGRISFICIRVGWCQPGDNLPTTLSAAGTPTLPSFRRTKPNVTDQWFKNMWLSNRDFAQLFEKAIFADESAWPDNFIVVNGVSANTGMKWSLNEARDLLNYEPVDDANSSM